MSNSDPPFNLPPIAAPLQKPASDANPSYQPQGSFNQSNLLTRAKPNQPPLTLPGVSALSQHLPITQNLQQRHGSLPSISDPQLAGSSNFAHRPQG